MRTRWRLCAAVVLALTGASLAGSGLYIKAKAVVAQVLLERAFAAGAHGAVKPWPWADVTAVARLNAPGHGISQIVLSGASGEALAFGPGHQAGTAQPGASGPVVYSGHRDTHFRWLEQVRPGDTLSIETPGGSVFEYRVQRTRVSRYDASGIDPDNDDRRLVLATCWPFDATTQGPMRYIVEARQITAQEKRHAASKAQDGVMPVRQGAL